MATPTGDSLISITDAAVEFTGRTKLSKPPELIINNVAREIMSDRSGNQSFSATFNPAIEVERRSQVTLNTYYGHRFRKDESDTTSISVNNIGDQSSIENDGRAVWQGSFSKFKITIGFRQIEIEGAIASTTDEIFKVCPRFRILVIGKSGVGKSSLINYAFGVKDANVSDLIRGKSDIDKEIITDDNSRFVLHDSKGFEQGDKVNLEIVTDFIRKRSGMPELKDRLHAIWLCAETSWSGNRILETGDESFLKGELDDQKKVPLIVVFTKYDLLVASKELELINSGRTNLTDQEVTEAADAFFEKKCAEVIPSHIKYTKVSRHYNETMATLVKLTYDEVKARFGDEASITTGIAQKPDISLKIKLSIDVGRKKYWQGLVSDIPPEFLGRSLKACLDVLHRDIIAVWNFNDPTSFLNEEAKKMMTETVNDLVDRDTINPTKTLTVGFSGVVAISGLIGGLSGPAAPIVIPIVAGVVLAAWVYTAYEKTKGTSRCLLGYIVGLIIVMQYLFPRVDGRGGENEVVDIKASFEAALGEYKQSVKTNVHKEITSFVQSQALQRMDRDKALNKVTDLIKNHSPKPIR